MLDTTKIDKEILDDISWNLGREVYESVDPYLDRIARMDIDEAFDRYMTWHGMIGWSSQIKNALNKIQDSACVD